jgi:hypothetical protein
MVRVSAGQVSSAPRRGLLYAVPLQLFNFMKTIPAILLALCVSIYWANVQTAAVPLPIPDNTGQTTFQDTPNAAVERGADQKKGKGLCHVVLSAYLRGELFFWERIFKPMNFR